TSLFAEFVVVIDRARTAASNTLMRLPFDPWSLCGARDAHALLGERGARRREARDRDAERRAGHVVQADVVEELDRARIAAVLAADADLELRLDLAAAPRRDRDELADAVLVEARERVLRQDALGDVDRQERAHVVARVPVG